MHILTLRIRFRRAFVLQNAYGTSVRTIRYQGHTLCAGHRETRKHVGFRPCRSLA